MQDDRFSAKLALTGIAAAGAERFGWVGWLVVLWIACFTTDYITGSLAAHKNGAWSSTKAREGLWHKGAMITVVLVALLFDVTLSLAVHTANITLPFRGVVITPIVLIWYIITELGSILENAVKMGAEHVPAWLERGLAVMTAVIDRAGTEAVGEKEQEDGDDER